MILANATRWIAASIDSSSDNSSNFDSNGSDGGKSIFSRLKFLVKNWHSCKINFSYVGYLTKRWPRLIIKPVFVKKIKSYWLCKFLFIFFNFSNHNRAYKWQFFPGTFCTEFMWFFTNIKRALIGWKLFDIFWESVIIQIYCNDL